MYMDTSYRRVSRPAIWSVHWQTDSVPADGQLSTLSCSSVTFVDISWQFSWLHFVVFSISVTVSNGINI